MSGCCEPPLLDSDANHALRARQRRVLWLVLAVLGLVFIAVSALFRRRR